MVSKSNVIETNTKCICGNGDEKEVIGGFFQNLCACCGKEGTLKVETTSNTEVNPKEEDESETVPTDQTNNELPLTKIVCTNCGSEYCGQDGYDLSGGTRSSLTTVNPNEVTEDEDEEASSTEEGETTYMSGWEGLCDLLKPLDGQAMMVQRGDFVVVKKIEMPQVARLWAYEGINVVDDSVSITDYTPEIYNTFIIKWGESFENELEFTFNKHKQLFGERKIVIEAKKYTVAEDENAEQSDESDKSNEENNNEENNTPLDKNSVSESVANSSQSTPPTDTTGDLGSMDSETGTGTGDEEAPETEEVPITDREEAIQFGLTQVGKAKREDGHTIELKVIGNINWQMGEWCHVRLPSFNEDSYMFISKCGFESSPDNEYINSLTLVDYPPSLGKPSKKEDENKDEEESDTGTDTSNSDTNSSDNNENTDDSNNTNDENNSDSSNNDNANNN